ncbi:uncharacterized protein YgiM (DUF1202 family) [Streptohalobacillus salinus]|uniref:Uncharacterized protein YgiM (DUF1202 family) n=1 Tax=Streptohalobacillus salinus TaxID=621096 RepID=A0A2V3WH78_9BACI|nr:SH3 domain-containing protein [Streptohalobacillus salinus]PXW92937.1 uncharacterized protein YgiM (DUF1202 family) [Streptohalobacillus salinus]
MQKQHILAIITSILSLIIIIALVFINQNQTFRILTAQSSNQRTAALALKNLDDAGATDSEDDETDLDAQLPLDPEAFATLIDEHTVFYVDASSLNMREGPSTDYEITGHLVLNDEVYIGPSIDDSEWIPIQSGDSYGFVNESYISAEKNDVYTPETSPEQSSTSSPSTTDTKSNTSTTTKKKTSTHTTSESTTSTDKDATTDKKKASSSSETSTTTKDDRSNEEEEVEETTETETNSKPSDTDTQTSDTTTEENTEVSSDTSEE